MDTSHDDMATAYTAVHDTGKDRLVGPASATDAYIWVQLSSSSLPYPCYYLSNAAGRSKWLTMLRC